MPSAQLVKELVYSKKASQNFRREWRKKSNLSFPAACTSEMTPLMTGAAERPSCNPLVKKAQRAFLTV